MNVWLLALQEIRIGLRNRWVIATTLVLGALSLSLVLLGSAPTGEVKADSLAIIVVSLASLSIFLLPLIALLLSYDAIVGEQERGTLVLLLSYPVARWQVVLGKVLGHTAILAFATIVGYGAAAVALWLRGDAASGSIGAFGAMVLTSIMLGASFVAIGCLASTVVRERATAAGLAVGAWLFFVLIYDTAVLGVLVADQGRTVGERGLNALLLLNPTDVYRLLNLAGATNVSSFSGMSGLAGTVAPNRALLLCALAAWTLVPLALAAMIFSRREL